MSQCIKILHTNQDIPEVGEFSRELTEAEFEWSSKRIRDLDFCRFEHALGNNETLIEHLSQVLYTNQDVPAIGDPRVS